MPAPVIAGRETTNSSGASVSSLDVSVPSGVSAGDLLVVLGFAPVDGVLAFFENEPSGFTEIETAGNGTSDSQVGAWYKTASGSETTVTINVTSSRALAGACYRITGHDADDPVNVIGGIVQSAGSTQNNPSLTTTEDDCLVFSLGTFDGSDGVLAPGVVSASAGWSEEDLFATHSGAWTTAGASAAVFSKEVSTAGASGICTLTWPSWDGHAGFQFAIAPGGSLAPLVVSPSAASATSGSRDPTLRAGDDYYSTIGPGGSFDTIAAWQSARSSGSSAGTVEHGLFKEGDHDVVTHSIFGFASSVVIGAVASHQGQWNSGGARIVPTGVAQSCLAILQANVTVEDLVFDAQSISTGSGEQFVPVQAYLNATVRRCIFQMVSTRVAAIYAGVWCLPFWGSVTVNIDSCVFIEGTAVLAWSQSGTGLTAAASLRQCTLHNADLYAAANEGTASVIFAVTNCLIGGDSPFTTLVGSGSPTIQYLALNCTYTDSQADIATGAGAGVTILHNTCHFSKTFGTSLAADTVAFENLTINTWDFHLLPGPSNFAHVKGSTANGLPEGDFERTPFAVLPDVGADQTTVVLPGSAGGVTPTAVPPAPLLGPIFFTPNAASADAEAVDPQVVLGELVIVPPAASATVGAAAPQIILGPITVAPSAAVASTSAVDPQVVLGAVVVVPAAAATTAGAADPQVVLGAVVVSPAAASASAEAAGPQVLLGPITVTPSGATANAGAADPQVVLGAVVVSPSAASTLAEAVDPQVVLGDLVVIPSAASALAGAEDPGVVLGGIAPSPASAEAGAENPQVVLGSVVVQPEAATATARAALPTLVQVEMQALVLTSDEPSLDTYILLSPTGVLELVSADPEVRIETPAGLEIRPETGTLFLVSRNPRILSGRSIYFLRQRIQNALIEAAGDGTFMPASYDPETGLLALDGVDLDSIKPRHIGADEVSSLASIPQRNRQESRQERNTWMFELMLEFVQGASVEIFEREMEDQPIVVAKDKEKGLRQATLLWRGTRYEHPPMQNTSSGTRAILTFEAQLSPV